MRLNVPAAQILGMAAHELARMPSNTGPSRRRAAASNHFRGGTAETRDFDCASASAASCPLTERKGFGTTVLENMVGRRNRRHGRAQIHPIGIELALFNPGDRPIDPQQIHGRR